MAIWLVEVQRKKTSVTYVNLQTHERVPCGDNPPECPLPSILDWLSENSRPGDAIFVNGVPVLSKMPEASA